MKQFIISFTFVFTISAGASWALADGISRCQAKGGDEVVFVAKTIEGKQKFTYTFCSKKSEWGGNFAAPDSYFAIRTQNSDPDDLDDATLYDALAIEPKSKREEKEKEQQSGPLFVLVPQDSTDFTVENVITVKLLVNEAKKQLKVRITTVSAIGTDETVKASRN